MNKTNKKKKFVLVCQITVCVPYIHTVMHYYIYTTYIDQRCTEKLKCTSTTINAINLFVEFLNPTCLACVARSKYLVTVGKTFWN